MFCSQAANGWQKAPWQVAARWEFTWLPQDICLASVRGQGLPAVVGLLFQMVVRGCSLGTGKRHFTLQMVHQGITCFFNKTLAFPWNWKGLYPLIRLTLLLQILSHMYKHSCIWRISWSVTGGELLLIGQHSHSASPWWQKVPAVHRIQIILILSAATFLKISYVHLLDDAVSVPPPQLWLQCLLASCRLVELSYGKSDAVLPL